MILKKSKLHSLTVHSATQFKEIQSFEIGKVNIACSGAEFDVSMPRARASESNNQSAANDIVRRSEAAVAAPLTARPESNSAAAAAAASEARAICRRRTRTHLGQALG